MSTRTSLEKIEAMTDGEAILALADNHHLVLDEFLDWSDDFHESYAGEFGSDMEFAEDFIDSTDYLRELPEHLAQYFDYEKFARDMMYDYWKSDRTSNFTCYYFRSI